MKPALAFTETSLRYVFTASSSTARPLHLPTASPLRAAVTARAQPAGADTVPAAIDSALHTAPSPPSETTDEGTDEPLHRNAARYAWALLLARIYEVLPLLCPRCGGQMRIIAFITEAVAVRTILAHLGEPTAPPRLAKARGPPLWEIQGAAPGAIDPQALPAPDYEFDQRVAW